MYLRKKPSYAALAENVLYWQGKEVCVITHFFQNMPAKTNLPPAFIVACYISLLLKTRSWWKTLCHLPTAWSNSSFFSVVSCLSLSHRRRTSPFWGGCPKLPVSQRNVNCHISKELKMVKWNIHSSKINTFNSFIFTEKLPYLQLSPTFFSCAKSSNSFLIIFDTFSETVFWE